MKLTYSQLAFPVSQRPVPGSKEVIGMTVGSGKKLIESLPKSNRDGSSLKMLRDYLLLSEAWYSTTCYLNWKIKGTKSRHLLFQLVPSTPRTEGTGCGLLLTPAAMERGSEGVGFKYITSSGSVRRKNLDGTQSNLGLSHQSAMLPTPNTMDYLNPMEREKRLNHKSRPGRTVSGNLREEIIYRMLPTPQNSDWKGGNFSEKSIKMGTTSTHSLAAKIEVGKKTGLKLQPAFVEWMMGYPDKWTELTD